MRASSKFAIAFGLPLSLVLVWTVTVWLGSRVPGHELVIKWEGALISRNFRDLGQSLNGCLGGTPLLAEGKAFRSAMWFSGFACSGVGAPATILSLNYDPTDRHEFYCIDDLGVAKIGRHFNTQREINDIEYAANWSTPTFRGEVCRFFQEGFAAIVRGERLLIHCDAGRDRTGTYAAILQALAAETAQRFDDALIEAVECDYRRTQSLAPAKFGRMSRFLREVQQQGGVARFLETHCGLSAADSLATGRALLAGPPPVL